MGRSTSDERFVAVCVAKGRLYRVGNAEEVKYSDDEVDRPLRIGQWVMVEAELGEITKITEVSDYVPTEVRNGVLFLDVKIEFRRSPHDCTLNLARCSELSEDILVPTSIDITAFNFEDEYGMIITPATQSEINFYHYETGGETRWKLFLEHEETFEEVQRPQYQKKSTINSEEAASGIVRRTGIIVGVSASGQRQFVYTPEEPVGKDGMITTGQGEHLEMGDWIKFDVSLEEAQRIFVRKEKVNFTVLDYRKTDPLLPTTVNDKKGSIELVLENFTFSQECRSVSNKGGNMIRHRELGLIADIERSLDKFRIDSKLDIRIARTLHVRMHDTIWAVIGAKLNKEGTVTRKPVVEMKRTETTLLPPPPRPAIPVASKDNVLDWRNFKESEKHEAIISYKDICVANLSDDKEKTLKMAPPRNRPNTHKTTDTDKRQKKKYDLNNNYDSGEVRRVDMRNTRNEIAKRHRAFVTGISPIKTYLWVCDETNPRRSTMYILGDENPLKLGQWIEGDFKRVYIMHERRAQFVCVENTWESIESPSDIDTRRSRDADGFQMVVVRVNVSYSVEKKCMINKYIGEITDPRSLIPRDAIDREVFSAVITLSRREGASLYDWTIERLEVAASFELQCRSELEKKVKNVMESRARKERKGKNEEDVVEKMKSMRVKAQPSKSKSTSDKSGRREFYGRRKDH